MAHYKDRVRADLDRWIAGGLVSADKRDAILGSIPDARRLDASTALAWVGGVLLGISIIAFISANWDIMPKLARFAILLIGFLATAGLGAWAAQRDRKVLSNIALMIATLVFAAAIGLTGQIFDIVSEPRNAFYAAGVAGFALALAGRSTGAATVALIFIALGDFSDRHWFMNDGVEAPWMIVFAPLSAFMALRWGSAPLAHASALAIIYCFGWFAGQTHEEASVFLFLSIGMAAMAAAARWLFTQGRAFASVFYGWFAWGALVLFACAGYVPLLGDRDSLFSGVTHRVVWLAASGGLIALGRFDRHALVTAVGVLSMIGAICALLMDLGLDLRAAAGVFLVCAVLAMIAGFMLRKRASA